MQQKLSVLWIAGWFPTKNNPYAGNFIERHAIACSQDVKIHLFHAALHPFGKQPNQPLSQSVAQNCPYVFHFISIPQFQQKVLKPLNLLIYYLKFWFFILKSIKNIEPVNAIHVHAPDKCGLIAVWLKKKLRKPLVLTEHWAIYNTPVPDHFLARNWFFQFQMRTVWKNADVAAQVSKPLHTEMEKIFKSGKPMIEFHNVVDGIFYYKAREIQPRAETFKLLHVSNGEPRKNVELIIQAAILLKQQIKVTIDFVGFDTQLNKFFEQRFVHLSTEAGLLDTFWKFHGKKYPSEIKTLLDKCDCLVMASSSENAPCVIAEALCAGVPVVSSNVGGISDMINPENGVLFEFSTPDSKDIYNKKNLDSLYLALQTMHQKLVHQSFSNIQENAVKIYAAETISYRLNQLYLSL